MNGLPSSFLPYYMILFTNLKILQNTTMSPNSQKCHCHFCSRREALVSFCTRVPTIGHPAPSREHFHCRFPPAPGCAPPTAADHLHFQTGTKVTQGNPVAEVDSRICLCFITPAGVDVGLGVQVGSGREKCRRSALYMVGDCLFMG